ncbi:MAG: NUDIX hydrolase, associated with thiamine pyrophosphokinase [Burkholderiaceae bacterium]|nr:MAG: NUDIX hydrolase, associated with thiamine pyrophosphokinase [Burkholderiaceae bacterium]
MTPWHPDPAWISAVRASANQPPRDKRLPLVAGGATIGSVEPGFLEEIAVSSKDNPAGLLLKIEQNGIIGWHLGGEVTATLGCLAEALRSAGRSPAWRNEQLAVCDEAGRRLGTVERAMVRVLGITTHAVHLVGARADGRVWVQQRAFDKPNDPGLWDTMVGGMIAADETVLAALARETAEEAGLALDALQPLVHGGRVVTHRPTPDASGAGYMVEQTDWYHCTVPDRMKPENRDGEVERFALLTRKELLARLQRDEFTTEASMILSAWFELG